MARRSVTLVALLLAASVGSSALAQDADADALCGRGRGELARLAASLDGDAEASRAWRSRRPAALAAWLTVPDCEDATDEERARSNARRTALRSLRARLEHAEALTRLGSAVAGFRKVRLASHEWPGSDTCPTCAGLLTLAERTIDAADRWPASRVSTDARIGELLAAAASMASPVDRLCTLAATLPGVGDVTRRFRYFTWTRSGTQILEIHRFLTSAVVSDACRPQ